MFYIPWPAGQIGSMEFEIEYSVPGYLYFTGRELTVPTEQGRRWIL
jgi:hypothetical protein